MDQIVSDFFLWKIDQNKMKDFIKNNNSASHQLKLIHKTISCKVNTENPVDPEFCLKFIKALLRILETNGAEVEETLYDVLHEVQLKAVQPQLEHSDKSLVDKYFKSYFIEDQVVSLAETKQIISDGTTGLTSWPAGIHLSYYISQNNQHFKQKKILELGSGTGITGIFCLKSKIPSKYILTDCHPKVLSNLEINLEHNLASDSSSYSLATLDWEAETPQTDNFADIDVVLGADIVFDSRIIPDLVKTIKNLISRKLESLAFIASTIRNEKTYAHFLKELSDQELCCVDCDYETSDPIKIIKIQLNV